MKTQLRSCGLWFLAAGSFFLIFAWQNISALANQPAITSIRSERTNVMVEVSVPSGLRRITLETRSRLGAGTWAPVAVVQSDGTAKTLTFRISCTRQTELMRVKGEAKLTLPSAFYTGTNSFEGPVSSPSTVGSPGDGGVATSGGAPASNGDAARTVVESDIWQIDGARLYFFNQYRGLQVIDISAPDKAKILGTLELPAAGEQMYLPDTNHVVLLANGPCNYTSAQSQIVIVNVENGGPSIVTNLPFEGSLQDSRMVGTALYVAAQSYRPVPNASNGIWEWGTRVSSFDLANPEKPVQRSTLWYPGYGNVVNSTDTYLFVGTQDPLNWYQSVVQVIDVTAPDGTMAPAASLTTAGHVSDKFKLNYANGVFTSISENWRWNTGTGPITKLETFRLPDPRSMGPGGIVKLGELELGSGEQLHATRFDGNLVYVVTFFQIDPLWVVDLSDPANPHIAGSVDVPGWSTYIAPLGDRLVTVGVESNRVAVSLFDVHDPAQPISLSRVLLGENYSWSDANWDEKTFTVLPEQGLVLVPYSGTTTNGYTSQVQLLDLTRSNLVARGQIEHQWQTRRTAFAKERVLSLSGWDLLSVDITDRDHPEVKGTTQLAWPVDRVFVQGDYLLQISGSTGWYGYQAPPSIRVTPAHDAAFVLNTAQLDDLPIVGISLKNGRLYVAQAPSSYNIVAFDGAGGPGGGPVTNSANFFLTILDATHLPDLPVLGQASADIDSPGWAGNWNTVWPSSNVVVWAGGGGYVGLMPFGGIAVLGPGGFYNVPFWPWWGSPGGELVGFDVGDPAAPRLESKLNLATNQWWSFSKPFCSDTRVYLSHATDEVETNSTNPNGIWSQKYALDVIDYADAQNPTVRAPVNIPGDLQGISHGGELLYTLGMHWATASYPDWTQWLEASAYDGVSAHLVASLALPGAWRNTMLVVDTNIFLANPGLSNSGTNTTPPTLQAWSLSAKGAFTLNGSTNLQQSAYLLVERDNLLAAQENFNSLELFDVSAPQTLSRLTTYSPAGCLWYDLTDADGGLSRGLWVPLGYYGVQEIRLAP